MKNFKPYLYFLLLAFISSVLVAATMFNKNKPTIKLQHMKLKMTIGNNIVIADLYDNPTTQDFISRLPLTVELEDYASNEKIFYPKPKLSTLNAPGGYKPQAGDITYYAPWGDIAIFYKDFSYSSGLISLGKVVKEDVKFLKFTGNHRVSFELLED